MLDCVYLCGLLVSSEALASMKGEDIMLGIYDNIQDELRDTVKVMKNEKDKVRLTESK